MSGRAAALAAFLGRHDRVVLAALAEVRGSSPREAGAFMLVAPDAAFGTIGGGQLEYIAMDRARQMLRDGIAADRLDVPLGPEIGQCCGGRVAVSLTAVDAATAARLRNAAEAEDAALPSVFVFGAGHVGRALARALALLPVRTTVVDTRPGELQGLPESVAARAVALPEAVVRTAPPGSAFVVLTHDHALDFLVAAEALGREDAAYVGMVGSRTKRAKFASWFRAEGGAPAALARLVCPIGSQGIGDKRPEVIAALAAAEIMVHIAGREARSLRARPVTKGRLGAVDGR